MIDYYYSDSPFEFLNHILRIYSSWLITIFEWLFYYILINIWDNKFKNYSSAYFYAQSWFCLKKVILFSLHCTGAACYTTNLFVNWSDIPTAYNFESWCKTVNGRRRIRDSRREPNRDRQRRVQLHINAFDHDDQHNIKLPLHARIRVYSCSHNLNCVRARFKPKHKQFKAKTIFVSLFLVSCFVRASHMACASAHRTYARFDSFIDYLCICPPLCAQLRLLWGKTKS